MEDFAKGMIWIPLKLRWLIDPSIQDEWVFSQFEQFLERSKHDPVLSKRLHDDKIVFFFHLLATDTIGHSKKPFSEAYAQSVFVSRLFIR
jgi:phosphatidylinositol glycan class N